MSVLGARPSVLSPAESPRGVEPTPPARGLGLRRGTQFARQGFTIDDMTSRSVLVSAGEPAPTRGCDAARSGAHRREPWPGGPRQVDQGQGVERNGVLCVALFGVGAIGLGVQAVRSGQAPGCRATSTAECCRSAFLIPTDAALLLLLLILLVIWVRQRVGIWRLARRYHRRAR